MSDYRLTVGLFVPMPEGVDPEFIDKYRDDQTMRSVVQVGYYDTLLYILTDERMGEADGFITVDAIDLIDDFRFEAKEAGFGDIDILEVKSFTDLWYDGADSNHMQLTADDVRKI